ncbi:MAG: hypothetical protein LBE37_11385 [Sphingobacterium sp.]|jgi:hypothetical protein|nr:hypothetical protein [Sphingobacterium sp.]
MIEWNFIDNLLPTFDTPVFLSKSPQEDYNNCRVGRLILDDNKENLGWFVGNDIHVISLSSMPYWAHVLDNDSTILMYSDDKSFSSTIKQSLTRLANFEHRIIQIAKAMISSGAGMYPLDYLISGILNRSLSLLYGFHTLVESNNYLAAAHLIRPHLDNFLRLYASYLVDSPHEFGMEIWKGSAIHKLKDRHGQFMKDFYLKSKASEEYPWMKNVYEETSGFIHFSNKHISNATRLSDDKGSLNTFVGKTDYDVSDNSKLEGILCMIEITNCILLQVYGWIETKRIEKHLKKI